MANFREFSEGEALKEAIVTRNDSKLLEVLMKNPSKDLLRSVMDDDGNSPFLLACMYSYDRIEPLSALLRAGSNPKARNRHGNTAIHIVCASASPTRSALVTIKFLYTNYALPLDTKNASGLDALWPAVARGDLNAYKFLKSFGGDLEAINPSGETLIFPAIRSGNFELVKFMIERDKMKLDIANKMGETPLHIAARSSGMIYTYILRTRQVDVDAKDCQGRRSSDLLTEAQA